MKIADISKWQGNVNWDKARKELDFVIFRASCGHSIDSKFLANVAACGVPYGAYHYVKAGTADESRAEARFFVECVRKAAHQPNFYIADIEYKTQTATTTEAVCVAFLEELRSLSCKKIGLYINTRYKWAGRAIAMCDIVWIPHYGKNTGDIPGDQYKPKHPYDLWQYTSKGSLAGVSGDVDLNVLSGAKPLEFFTRKDGEAPMSYDPKKVIDIALAEVGYLEKETNSQLDDKTANAGDKNITKYARDLDALGFYNSRKQGVAWCDMFVDWDFVKAYGMEVALAITFQPYGKPNCGAGCKYSRQYYKNNGRLFDNPEPGDQVFFYSKDKSSISHTGLVYAVDSSYVYTVEGNTSSKSGVVANGGAVERKKYKRNYNRLAGFGRPDYGKSIEPAPSVQLGDRLPLVKGDTGDDVAQLQEKLKSHGYDLGAYGANKDGVDGDYGSKTVEAVKAYQTANGLTVNGKYDEATHAVMSGAAPAPAQPEPPKPVQPPEGKKVVVIKCDSGKVNIRQGDSTSYPSIKQATDGTTFEYVVTSPTGWHGIRYKKCIAWVSPKYSVVTDG